jgi:L-fuculose-phosphate aldolase
MAAKQLTAQETREMLLGVAKEMLRTGLVEGTSGNLSARLPDGNLLLTPSSLPYETMELEDLVVCDPDGNVLEGTRGPTSEKALHCSCLRLHDDIGAVIHSHAKFASMFAVVRQPIPAVIEEFQVFVGGDVPVAEYKETGSDALADEVAKHVGDRSAVLMANHGLLTVGMNPQHAMKIASLVERTAEIVWGARQLGTIHELPAELRSKWTSIYGFLRTNPM